MPGRQFVGATGYRYGFNGKESDDEIKGSDNSYDFGGRLLDVRLGRWYSVDPLFGKFAAYSPYNFGVNSPLSVIDTDGNDIYLLTQATSKEGSGHTMIAVDNYKKAEENVYDKAGNITIHKGDWIPDGTVTVYDFNIDAGQFERDKSNVSESIYGTVKANKNVKKEDIINGKLKTDGDVRFQGVISISTTKDVDDQAKTKLEKFKTDVNSKKIKYNAITNNCSDMAADIINDIKGFEKVSGKEDINPIGIPKQESVTTPNQLFKEAKSVISKDKTLGRLRRFSERLIKDWVDAYTGGLIKDKTPGK